MDDKTCITCMQCTINATAVFLKSFHHHVDVSYKEMSSLIQTHALRELQRFVIFVALWVDTDFTVALSFNCYLFGTIPISVLRCVGGSCVWVTVWSCNGVVETCKLSRRWRSVWASIWGYKHSVGEYVRIQAQRDLRFCMNTLLVLSIDLFDCIQ